MSRKDRFKTRFAIRKTIEAHRALMRPGPGRTVPRAPRESAVKMRAADPAARPEDVLWQAEINGEWVNLTHSNFEEAVREAMDRQGTR